MFFGQTKCQFTTRALAKGNSEKYISGRRDMIPARRSEMLREWTKKG